MTDDAVSKGGSATAAGKKRKKNKKKHAGHDVTVSQPSSSTAQTKERGKGRAPSGDADGGKADGDRFDSVKHARGKRKLEEEGTVGPALPAVKKRRAGLDKGVGRSSTAIVPVHIREARKGRSKRQRTSIEHPFEVVDADHCETPKEAISHVAWILDTIAARLGKSRRTLKIYDPYFCEGSVRKHWNALGFQDVYNKCEDFYTMVAEARTPAFDILVTNPPFSGEHMRKCVEFCMTAGKPFLLLVPSFVHKKQYFTGAVALHNRQPLFVVPQQRYQFKSPGDGTQTAPFVTMWHIDCLEHRAAITDAVPKNDGATLVCLSATDVPAFAVPVRTDAQGLVVRRQNPKARRRMREKMANSKT